jgi:hypothetical protein
MKPIDTYNIVKDDWVCYNSKICSVACSLGFTNQHSMLDNRIDELVKSFFNQWQFVISTYQKLCEMLETLNKCSDTRTHVSIFSEYDNESTSNEIDFKNYSYLLIVSLKTYLDLFACLVDIIQNQVIREEKKLPDFYNFGQREKEDICGDILIEFNKLRDKDMYPWIALIKEVRNKIIHRGYHLKPGFGFKKSEKLPITVYKGTDMYCEVIDFEIEELFHNFMTGMPIIEEKVSSIVLECSVALKNKLIIDASFRYGGLMNEYKYSELVPSN